MGDHDTYTTRRARREAEQGERGARARFRTGFTTLRDLLLFVAGMGIIGHEVFYADVSDAAVIGVGLALTGAPLVLGADERKAKGG